MRSQPLQNITPSPLAEVRSSSDVGAAIAKNAAITVRPATPALGSNHAITRTNRTQCYLASCRPTPPPSHPPQPPSPAVRHRTATVRRNPRTGSPPLRQTATRQIDGRLAFQGPVPHESALHSVPPGSSKPTAQKSSSATPVAHGCVRRGREGSGATRTATWSSMCVVPGLPGVAATLAGVSTGTVAKTPRRRRRTSSQHLLPGRAGVPKTAR